MSNYNSLKATINANVKLNGNQEITGQVLNGVLNAMVNSLGAGYQYIGIATPTSPGSDQTPDYKCFYLAITPGTYSHLGGLVVNEGEVCILKFDTSWTKEVTGIATAASVQAKQDIITDLAAIRSGAASGATAVQPAALAAYFLISNIVSQLGESADKVISQAGITAILADYAKINGIYDSMIVGAAKNLVGHGAVPASFLFRTAGGNNDIGTGAAQITELKGNGMVWNQLCPFTSTPTITNATWSNNNLLATAKNGQVYWDAPAGSIIVGHKYIQITILKTTAAAGQIRAFSLGEAINLYNVAESGSYQVLAGIATATNTLRAIAIRDARSSGWDAIEVKSVILIDLTILFNGSVPENFTAADFKEMFPLDYYAYNAGEVLPFCAENLVTTGFNQYNPATGKALLLGGQSDGYQITGTYTSLSFTGVSGATSTITPDSNGKFNVTENGELTVTGGDATSTCVHLVWSGYRNGEYEPYEKHTLEVDPASWEDTDGNLIFPYGGMFKAGYDYDFAKAESDGFFHYATRVWDRRAYASGDESDSSVITDGHTYTYFKLATPVTKELATPVPASYYVNDFGTEEWQPANTADPYTAPCNLEIAYAMNAVDTLRRLGVNYIKKQSMDNILTAFKNAGIIAGYSLTYNSANDDYDCVVTAP